MTRSDKLSIIKACSGCQREYMDRLPFTEESHIIVHSCSKCGTLLPIFKNMPNINESGCMVYL